MTAALERLRCPACGGDVAESKSKSLRCPRCPRDFEFEDAVLDMRIDRSIDAQPWPLVHGDLDRAFECAASGLAYRAMLEGLLLDLPEESAERMMLLMREARGAWFPLLDSSGGELLFVGNSFSGTVTPLTDAGFRVTILERSPQRARFARIRGDAHSPGRTAIVLGGDSRRLPFADQCFDVVVQEDGLSANRRVASQAAQSRGPAFAHDLSECRRVSRGETILIADNRLGYKRSSGRRGDFRVPSAFEFVAGALAPARGERTLLGYRRLFSRAGCERTRAFALYPHAQDFSHIVAIDGPTPALTIGPMERKNRLKLAARAIGLFPVLTPSFAIIGERAPERTEAPKPLRSVRIERILAELAERIGEPAPVTEQIVSTRGNTAIVHTFLPDSPAGEPSGRWTLHLPLAPKNIPQCERHIRTLELLRASIPSVPVPEPLFIGRADGVSVTCERRARGWTAPQRAGDIRRIETMLRETARHFAHLVVREALQLTEQEFAEQVSARFDLVARHAAVPSTIAHLARLHDEMRERLIGKRIARVIYHADLRAKHVQIDADGSVTGYLDWGTAEPSGLPYQDLLHLLVHERKQEAALSPARAWAIVRDREQLRDYERDSLASYAKAVGLDDETCRAMELMYPVLVAAMAEKNWEYSRPRWLHKQFGL
jgi:aminoglycoside phosphotransferase (APT) family kinase protein